MRFKNGHVSHDSLKFIAVEYTPFIDSRYLNIMMSFSLFNDRNINVTTVKVIVLLRDHSSVAMLSFTHMVALKRKYCGS